MPYSAFSWPWSAAETEPDRAGSETLVQNRQPNDPAEAPSPAPALAPKADINRIDGTNRPDTLRGTKYVDIIDGKKGDDRLIGRGADDILAGRKGSDTLLGGNGNDFLLGGPGSDILRGGKGADHFIFDSGVGVDVVKDYQRVDVLFIDSKAGAFKGADIDDVVIRHRGDFDTLHIDGDLVAKVFGATVQIQDIVI